MKFSYNELNTTRLDILDTVNIFDFIDDDIALTKTGDLQVAFELFLPEIYSLSDGDIDSICRLWENIFNKLKENYIFHKQDIYLKNTFTINSDIRPKEKNNFLNSANQRHFLNRGYLDHKSYLYITKCCSDTVKENKQFQLFQLSNLAENAVSTKKINDFKEAVSTVNRLLNNSIIKCKRLNKNEYINTVKRYISLDFSERPLKKEIARNNDNLFFGSKYMDVFSLDHSTQLPKITYSCSNDKKLSYGSTFIPKSFIAPIGISLPIDHVVNQYILTVNKQKVLKDLKKQAKMSAALVFFNEENALLSEDSYDYIEVLTKQDANAVRYHLNCTILSDHNDRLNNKDLLKNAFDTIGIGIQESAMASLMYFVGIPCNSVFIPSEKTILLTSEQASFLIINETSARSKPNPLAIRATDRVSSKPIWLDLHDEPFKRGIIHNHNKFVIGGAGSGKSFFMNFLSRNFYDSEGHVSIIDIGGSYTNTVDIINLDSHGIDGANFTPSEDKPLSFNPFIYAKNIDKDGQKLHNQMLVQLLKILWRGQNDVKEHELAGLERMVFHYMSLSTDQSRGTATFTDFYEFLQEYYKQGALYEEFTKAKFDIDNFCFTIEKYCTGGTRGDLLNSLETIDTLNNRFVLFELSKLTDHTEFLIVTLIITNSIQAKIAALPKGVPKMIVIEEAWSALLKANMAAYINELVRTIRKNGGQTIFVTQNVKDLKSSPDVKDAIVGNSDTKIVLDVKAFENDFDYISEVLGLSDFDKNQVLSLKNSDKENDEYRYNEFCVKMKGGRAQVYRLEVSKEEYWAYTTLPADRDIVNNKIKHYGNAQVAIDDIVQNKQESHG
ncbi:MAG: TraG family conjugative transposon ATPase [Solitalea-like symbiont of Acarus siro]